MTKKPTRQQKKILKLLAEGCRLDYPVFDHLQEIGVMDGSSEVCCTRRSTILAMKAQGWISFGTDRVTDAGREAAGIKS